MVRDQSAFAPFGVGMYRLLAVPSHVHLRLTIYSTGRRACVGKNLAMAQTRLVVARLVSSYRMRLAPSIAIETIERDMKDQLTAQLGDFAVIFEPL